MAKLRDGFFGQSVKSESVDVAGVGPVEVRGLTGGDYDEFEAGCTVDDGKGGRAFKMDRALLVKLTVYEPGTDTPVFAGDEVSAVRNLPASILNPIARVAVRLCGLDDDPGN